MATEFPNDESSAAEFAMREKSGRQRWALGVEYDGTPFVGWQWQKDGVSVQETVTQALSRVAGHPVTLHCAGRTDRGVHALGQVIHFDTDAQRVERNWLLGGNAQLPSSVSLLWARAVPQTFHARFSAQARRYRYVIANQAVRPALQATNVAWCRYPLTVEPMHAAAQYLLGEHDFTSFRAMACQAKSAVKRIHQIAVFRHERYVVLDVYANAFLHHMVRNIAGVLIWIGRGKEPPSWMLEVLAARDRRHFGVTAPSEGLYLLGVDYPESFAVPASAASPVWPIVPLHP